MGALTQFEARWIPIGLLLCLAMPSALEASDLPSRWSAQSAVQYALSGNPDIAIAQKRIEQARANLLVARSFDYPQVNLSAEYGQTNTPMYSFGNILNQGAFSPAIDFNDPGRTDNLRLMAEIRYRLYNGGKNHAQQERALAGTRHAEIERLGVHRELGFQVVKAFCGISQAQRMVEIRNQSEKAINASLLVARARHEVGDLLQQDLLNLELEAALARENTIRAQHDLELAKRAFLTLLGLPEMPVAIDAHCTPPQALPPERDVSRRHELLMLEAAQAIAQAELALAEGGRRPSVDAFASYQTDTGWELDESGDSWMAGVRVNYTLYDGRRSASEIAGAKLRLEEIDNLRRKTELTLGLDLQQAGLEYDQTVKRVEVTEKMVGVAEEVARLGRVRFKEGVILSSELIDFEVRLADAQARNLAATASRRVAIANLLRATGREQFPAQ